MSTLLVDGDIVAYQIAFRTEQPIRWQVENDEDGLWTLHSDEKDCRNLIEAYFTLLKKDTQCENVVVAFSDKENYRKKLFTDYKANRSTQRKPLTLNYCKEYISHHFKTIIKPTLEADDVLGILGTGKTIKGTKIIVTTDKDLDQIAGLHYNPVKKEFYKVSKKEADFNFYLQCLTGDQVDNYKGCPSYGEVKATRVLHGTKNAWKTIVDCYEEQGLDKKYALVQAQVARILRSTDYNYKRKEVKLWQPQKN